MAAVAGGGGAGVIAAAWLVAALLAGSPSDPDVHDLPPWTGAALPPPELGTGTPAAATTTTIRIATYNTSLYSERDSGLLVRLASGDASARKIAAVIQHVRPDVVLLNEFDFDAAGRAADVFQRDYLGVGQAGEAPIEYAYRFLAPVNTGVASGMDLNHDGKVGQSGREYGEDAFGYGEHPGQYGLLLLSRFPIDAATARTFQKLPWRALPGAVSPVDPATGGAWYPGDVWPHLRLSSKSHWDVPVATPLGTLHVLAAHPVPPVFDGPEDRNGVRNADEIRLWSEYLSSPGASWLCDDQGRCGGLAADARFVILGDHNNDPHDGDGRHAAINDLLRNPRVQQLPAPRSEGGVASARSMGGVNATQLGDPAEDTGSFEARIGNLHLDYVLPSTGLDVVASGVFWPVPGTTGSDWIDATDHRMVWIDVAVPTQGP
jgi:endonuclease/exonuclease/phosphatase family metal-dependent hydrolase